MATDRLKALVREKKADWFDRIKLTASRADVLELDLLADRLAAGGNPVSAAHVRQAAEVISVVDLAVRDVGSSGA